MKKAIIICNQGMSSSMIAKKTTDFFAKKNLPIEVDATTLTEAEKIIEEDEYDLYLLSPQVKMAYDNLYALIEGKGKKLENIPAEGYVPTDAGITVLAKVIFPVFKEELKAEKNKK